MWQEHKAGRGTVKTWEPGAQHNHSRKVASRIKCWVGDQGHQCSLWHFSGMSEREKASYTSYRCTIKHSGDFVLFCFHLEGSLSHFHHFDYNINKCLTKCNILSLRQYVRWKHSHIKSENINMGAGMIICWNYIAKSCFSWCSMSMSYIFGANLALYRAFVWFFFP